MNDYQIKLRYYVQFYLTTFIMILVLNSKDAGIITTFFVVGGIFVLLNYIILLEFCKNLVILLKRRQESKWFLGSFILQLIGIGLFISSIVINYELLIGPQMDSLTLPIFLYLIGVNLIEISGLIAYSTQEMSRGTFPWKIILGNILLIAYFNYAVFFYH